MVVLNYSFPCFKMIVLIVLYIFFPPKLQQAQKLLHAVRIIQLETRPFRGMQILKASQHYILAHKARRR